MYRLRPRLDSPLHPDRMIAKRNIEAMINRTLFDTDSIADRNYDIIYSGDTVLVESEPGILFRFPLATYNELCKFQHLDISLEICINNGDSMNEYGIPMVINLRKVYGINSVRELCVYMSRRVGVVESLGMYTQRQIGGKSHFEISEFVDIIYKNGESRYTMFDDFIRYFNLQSQFGNMLMTMYKFMA